MNLIGYSRINEGERGGYGEKHATILEEEQ